MTFLLIFSLCCCVFAPVTFPDYRPIERDRRSNHRLSKTQHHITQQQQSIQLDQTRPNIALEQIPLFLNSDNYSLPLSLTGDPSEVLYYLLNSDNNTPDLNDPNWILLTSNSIELNFEKEGQLTNFL